MNAADGTIVAGDLEMKDRICGEPARPPKTCYVSLYRTVCNGRCRVSRRLRLAKMGGRAVPGPRTRIWQ
jgi:hypothetical protein